MTVNPEERCSTHMPAGRAAAPPGISKPASREDWAAVDQVVLDLELPHIAIARGLEQLDDAAIWREYRHARDQGSFLDCLASMAGSYSTEQRHFRDRTRSTEWLHLLAVVPFLLPATSWPVAAPSPEDRGAAGNMYNELQRWVGCEQPVMTLVGCVRYTDLSRWSPVTQREYLQVLARKKRALTTPPEPMQAHLAEGTTQLAFLVCSVQCWNATSQLQSTSILSPAAWALRSRLAAYLSYGHQCAVQSQHVLLPAPLREGVLSGLRLWIGELVHSGLVHAWDLRPAGKDALVMELFDAADDMVAVLPVRLHQIGASALHTLTNDLQLQVGPPARRSFNDC